MDFQKQIDTLTGALSLFDLSYFLSGAAMMLALVYTFPEMRDFLFDDAHVVSSIGLCVVIGYILGLISWAIGKHIRYILLGLWNKKKVKGDFDKLFEEVVAVINVEERSKIKKMINVNTSLAYAYMWQKLDQSDSDDCKNRNAYIGRFWTFRAIYEGLILPVIVLAIAFYQNNIMECFCSSSCFCIVLGNFDICCVLLQLIYVIGVLVVVRILALEARKCFKIQLREVILAYGNFCSEETRNP